MLSFLDFQITHITECQTNFNSFLTFLLLPDPDKKEKETNKSGGVTITAPGHQDSAHQITDAKNSSVEIDGQNFLVPSTQNTVQHI